MKKLTTWLIWVSCQLRVFNADLRNELGIGRGSCTDTCGTCSYGEYCYYGPLPWVKYFLPLNNFKSYFYFMIFLYLLGKNVYYLNYNNLPPGIMLNYEVKENLEWSHVHMARPSRHYGVWQTVFWSGIWGKGMGLRSHSHSFGCFCLWKLPSLQGTSGYLRNLLKLSTPLKLRKLMKLRNPFKLRNSFELRNVDEKKKIFFWQDMNPTMWYRLYKQCVTKDVNHILWTQMDSYRKNAC